MKKVSLDTIPNQASVYLPTRNNRSLCSCLKGSFIFPNAEKHVIANTLFFNKLNKLLPTTPSMNFPNVKCEIEGDTVKLPVKVFKEILTRLRNQHNLLLQIKDHIDSYREAHSFSKDLDAVSNSPGHVKKTMEKIISENIRKSRLVEYLRKERQTLINQNCVLAAKSKELKAKAESVSFNFHYPSASLQDVVSFECSDKHNSRHFEQNQPLDYIIPSNNICPQKLIRSPLYNNAEIYSKRNSLGVSTLYLCRISYSKKPSYAPQKINFELKPKTFMHQTSISINKLPSILSKQRTLHYNSAKNKTLNFDKLSVEMKPRIYSTSKHDIAKKNQSKLSKVVNLWCQKKSDSTVKLTKLRALYYITGQQNFEISKDLAFSIIPHTEYTTFVDTKCNGITTHQIYTSHINSEKIQLLRTHTESTFCSSKAPFESL